MQVVIDQLASHGYQHMTIEGIAAAAGVHKATLYRWWPGKPALVAEALCAHMTVGPPPNTGTTRGDLIAWLKGTIANYTGTRAGVAMPALISDLAATPEGVTAFRQAFLTARRQGCRVLVQRGIDRGDIPAGTDIELFMDAIAGTIFYRQLVSGTPITRDLAAKIADLLLGQTAPQRRTRPTPSHPAGRHL
jgi:AcrR family transcriptional regulator